MPYPSGTLYPSTTTFPGTLGTAQAWDGLAIRLGTTFLSGPDSFGCVWYPDPGITGWDASPASSRQSTQKTRAPGAWGGPRSSAARSVVIPGRTRCPTPDAYAAAVERLCAAVTFEDTVLTITRGATTRSLICARQDEVITGELSPTAFSWSVQLGADDPRKFTSAVSGSTGLPSVTGGFNFPHNFPMSITTSIVSGKVALTNPGTASGAVLLRIDGPIVAPTVTHIGPAGISRTVGLSLSLNAGEYVLIDPTPDGQSVLAQGTTSRGTYITQAGWHTGEPGLNTWFFSAQSGTGMLTASLTPAYL